MAVHRGVVSAAPVPITEMTTTIHRGPAHARAHGLARRRRAAGPARPSRPGRVRDMLIGVLGVVGVLTVAWLLVSWLLGLSLVVLVTGSMAPTMPTGSAALVHTVTAADLAVGDVVTVPRPNSATPVTHRIVQIDTVRGDSASRSLILQGDANDVVDSAPYVVDEAPRVVAAAPHLGWVVLWAKTPTVMLALALLIAGAIAWALWPTAPPAQAPEPSDEKD